MATEDLHRSLLEIAGHPGVWPVVQSAKAHMDRLVLTLTNVC